MKVLMCLILISLTAACGQKPDNEYVVYSSGDKQIVFHKDDFKTNDPFPVVFNDSETVGSCLLWLSGVHNDGFNRSAYSYSISNCGGPKTEGGSYELDGTGLVLCENNLQCRTYERSTK